MRYVLLDCHRIHEGSKGGGYTHENTLALCVSHHRLVSEGVIKIHARRMGSDGDYIHWTDEQGVERFTRDDIRRSA